MSVAVSESHRVSDAEAPRLAATAAVLLHPRVRHALSPATERHTGGEAFGAGVQIRATTGAALFGK